MSRFAISGVYGDGEGNIVVSGTVVFYVYNASAPTVPTTVATFYEDKTGGSAVTSITTDSNGVYEAWFDDADYSNESIFTVITSKSTHTDVPYHFSIPGLPPARIKSGFEIDDTTRDHQYILAVNELSADRTITLPLLIANDIFVFADFIQTLTGKNIGDPTDNTKDIAFTLSGATTAKTLTLISAHTDDRSITFPDATDTLVGKATTDTLSNKKVGDPSDITKDIAFLLSGATTAKTLTLSSSHTDDRTFTYPDRTMTAGIILGTEQASTSSTAINFISIPAGVRKITIMFVGVSKDGTEEMLVQIGTSGTAEASGYLGGTLDSAGSARSTAGFLLETAGAAAGIHHGSLILTLEDSAAFTWTAHGGLARSDVSSTSVSSGSKSLAAELDMVSITTTGTPDDFDAGAINIQYEY